MLVAPHLCRGLPGNGGRRSEDGTGWRPGCGCAGCRLYVGERESCDGPQRSEPHPGLPRAGGGHRLLPGRFRGQARVREVPHSGGTYPTLRARGVHQYWAADQGQGACACAHNHLHLLQCGEAGAAGLCSGPRCTCVVRTRHVHGSQPPDSSGHSQQRRRRGSAQASLRAHRSDGEGCGLPISRLRGGELRRSPHVWGGRCEEDPALVPRRFYYGPPGSSRRDVRGCPAGSQRRPWGCGLDIGHPRVYHAKGRGGRAGWQGCRRPTAVRAWHGGRDDHVDCAAGAGGAAAAARAGRGDRVPGVHGGGLPRHRER
eukprot:RCo041484